MSFVLPETYWTGYTVLNMPEVERYLRDTDATAFMESIEAARQEGLSDGEILCSLYAKVCYASVVVGKNLNVSRVRDIPENLKATLAHGHGSVFEHCQLNFLVRNCSRVYTHEQVRHRQGPPHGNENALDNDLPGDGAAYSQTSGRYVRSDHLDLVIDPILEEQNVLSAIEAEQMRKVMEAWMKMMGSRIAAKAGSDFTLKKKLTSAARRFLPNGQANEMGFSLNLRSLRHILQLRTGRHAEWEIRLIYGQVYRLIKDKYPLMFADAKEEVVDGLVEVSGMRQQPYDNA